jgi:hypothetical protein
MVPVNKSVVALAVTLLATALASPGLARMHAHHAHHAGATGADGASAARSEAITTCNREADSAYPWYEDMQRAEVYRACMSEHHQPEE